MSELQGPKANLDFFFWCPSLGFSYDASQGPACFPRHTGPCLATHLSGSLEAVVSTGQALSLIPVCLANI